MRQSPEQRRLLAIMVADIVGYSRMMAADEAGTYARLKDMQQALVTPAVERNYGRIVKWTGDGFIATFDSAVDAVRASVEIQSGAEALAAPYPKDRRLVLRIGLNVGDVIVVPNDVYGDAVNIAARLQALAPAGGIAASQPVRDTVRGKFTVDFQDMGEHRVKNIPDPVRTFAVTHQPVAWTMERPVPVAVTERPKRLIPKYAFLTIPLIVIGMVALYKAYIKPIFEGPRTAQSVVQTTPVLPPAQPQTPAKPPAQPQQQANKPAQPAQPAKPAEPAKPPQVAATPDVQPPGPVPGLPPAETPEQAKQKFKLDFLSRVSSATPKLAPEAREAILKDYEEAGDHKAQAISLSTGRYWRAAQRPSPEVAAEQALEGCEAFTGAPCALIAVNGKAEPEPSGRVWTARPMPRVAYVGRVDGARIPTGDFTHSDVVQKYVAHKGYKALALHPQSWLYGRWSATSQSHAEEEALKACNDDRVAKKLAGPCYLYAAGDYVVFPQRLTEPSRPAGTTETLFDGAWSGELEDGAVSTLVVLAGKVVSFTLDGEAQTVSKTAFSGKTGAFGDQRYTADLTLDAEGQMTVEVSGPGRKTRGTLKKKD